MKASINRITFFLAVLLPTLANAQTFPAYLANTSKLPEGHPKIVQQTLAEGVMAPTVQAPPAVYPICVFDEMNAQLAQQNPSLAEALQHYIETEMPLLSANSADKSMVEPLLTISVVVHVIHNGEPIGTGQNLSTAQIQAQIDILNEDYTALNSQFYNTPSQWMGIAGFPNIQFCLANKKPNGTPTDGIDRQMMTVTGTSWSNNNINSTIKPAIKWDPLRYFNIYVLPIPGTTAQGGVVGFSNYPIVGQIGGNSDGVVIDYRWFGAPGFTASGYRPLTHETGHYLGLPHPFNGSSCSLDDGISDTPNVEISTRDLATLSCEDSYPNGPVSCGNEHLYVNYMDYVTENCYTSFTAGQVNVMRAVLNGTSSGFGYGSRNGLIQNAPQQCAIPATDAGITRIVSPENIACTTGQITPVVTLRNFGTNNLNTATIFYKINNATPVSLAWQGSLFAGQNLDVSLAPFTPTNGSYTLTVWTSQPNGLADQRTANDTTSANRFTYIATAPPMMENFENESTFPTSEGIFQLNVTNDAFVWQLTDEASGFGQGGESVLFDNFHDFNGANPGGTIDALITRHFDFSNLNDAMLKFDVAYAPYYDLIGDSLLVLIATNCSQNFNQIVYKRGGMDLATAPITTEPFTPTASQWRTEIVDLSAYDGMSDVTIALVNKSAFGNRLFLDNIGIGRNCNLLTASAVNQQADDCSVTCNGAATIQVANQNGGLHYGWEGFPSSFDQPTNSELCAGATTVTVTDGIGCTTQIDVQIAQQQTPQLTTASTNVSIYNGTNGTASVTVSNSASPYSYAWSNGFQQSNTNSTSSTASGLTTGSYTVTVTAGNGCSAAASVVVGSVCDGFSISAFATPATCFDNFDGSVIIFFQGGTPTFDVDWNTGAIGNPLVGLPAGNYAPTVTDANGCIASTTATVEQQPAILLSISSTGETSVGASDGTAVVSVSGGVPGYTYLWNTGQTTSSINGLSPGLYSVTVTDSHNCSVIEDITVNPVSCGSYSGFINIEEGDCYEDGWLAQASVFSGGVLPINYLWSDGTTENYTVGIGYTSISVTVTNGNGCILQLNSLTSSPPLLIATLASTDESYTGANNGTATINPTGGTPPYSVVWSNGDLGLTISNLSPGTYIATLTDALLCSKTYQVTVGTSPCFIGLQLSATPTTCPDFADGSATVSIQSGGTGPFNYLWSNGQTTATVSNLVSNSYTVMVTDASGCSQTGQVTVTSDDTTPPVINLIGLVEIELGTNGNTAIDPNLLVTNSSDNCSMVFLEVFPANVGCSNLGPMQVTLTASDNSGNQTTGITNLSVVDLLPPVITCPSNIIVNSCEPVVYAIPTALDNCSADVLLDLIAGLESGQSFPQGATTVTWSATDESGNAASCSFEVIVNYSFALSAELIEPSCYGASDGSIILDINGGLPPYSLDWGTIEFPINIQAGNYPVTVTDANGCSITETIQLTQPDELEIVLLSTTPSTTGQSNGQIDFSVNGGTAPFSLTWLQNGLPLPNFDPMAVAAGSYQLKVEDANGCLTLSSLITVGSVSGSVEAALERIILISPNPSGGIFVLKMEGVLTTIQFSVFNGTGRNVLPTRETSKGSHAETIDLQAFNAGVYWIKIVAGEAVIWRKLVKI